MSTDLRDLIAEAVWHGSGYSEAAGGMPFAARPASIRAHYLRRADAVIQALTEAGVLMPMLPEGLVVSRVFEHDYQIPGTRYGAVIYKPRPDGSWESPQQGDGPTIPAAITDALANGAGQ